MINYTERQHETEPSTRRKSDLIATISHIEPRPVIRSRLFRLVLLSRFDDNSF